MLEQKCLEVDRTITETLQQLSMIENDYLTIQSQNDTIQVTCETLMNQQREVEEQMKELEEPLRILSKIDQISERLGMGQSDSNSSNEGGGKVLSLLDTVSPSNRAIFVGDLKDLETCRQYLVGNKQV